MDYILHTPWLAITLFLMIAIPFVGYFLYVIVLCIRYESQDNSKEKRIEDYEAPYEYWWDEE